MSTPTREEKTSPRNGRFGGIQLQSNAGEGKGTVKKRQEFVACKKAASVK